MTLIVVVISTGMGVLACGSGVPRNVDSAFRDRANRICESAVVDHAKHPFPFASFDPLHPDPAELPELADYFTRYGHGPQVTNQLIALGEPAEGRTQWDTLMTLLKEATVNGQQQIAAASQRDVPHFVSLVKLAPPIHDAIIKAGRQAGFPASSACARMYG